MAGEGPVPVCHDSADGSPHVECPVCSCPFNHPYKVVVGPVDDDRFGVEVGRHGVRTKRGLAPARALGRGVAVAVNMHCEEGHDWTLTLAFHKGSSFLTASDVHDCEAEESHGALWRD